MSGLRKEVRPVTASSCGWGLPTSRRPHSMGGTHMRSPWGGGGALAVGGGAEGLVVPGEVEEGVLEKVCDAFAQGGCLDEGSCLDGLAAT